MISVNISSDSRGMSGRLDHVLKQRRHVREDYILFTNINYLFTESINMNDSNLATEEFNTLMIMMIIMLMVIYVVL